MPFIQVHIAAGLTRARKRQLIHEIVAVTSEAIGSDPKIINVVIHEHG
jgi:4-oxalocrotonate tautomerase